MDGMKRSNCKHQPNARHYELVGPLRTIYYGGYEPPEQGCDCAIVIAKNKNEARKMVTSLPEFRDYATEMRGDGKPPWYQVKTTEFICEHGNCWGCSNCVSCTVGVYDEDGYVV